MASTVSSVDSVLPARVFRNEAAYRTPALGRALVRDCAFIRKPTAAGGYRARVLKDYVGVYVLRGAGTFTDWDGRATRVDAGCFLQMPPGKPHSCEHDGDGRWAECWIRLDGEFAAALHRFGSIDDSRGVLRPGLHLDLVERFERILHDLNHAPDAILPQTLARAHELLASLHHADLHRSAPHPHAATIDAACATLGKDLDKPCDVRAIATAHGLSYERFRKVFRDRVGVSPGEYRIRRRIDRARALIAQQHMSNKQVAYELGYADPFTFSKQFKQVVGVSPEVFRKTV
jgi:AraC family transcriptional regulator of arabinose operon